MTATAASTASFITEPVIGFNLSMIDNPISTSSISGTAGLNVPNLGPQLTPGQTYFTNAGTVLYGVAGVTITLGDLLYFSFDSTYGEFTAKEATTAAISTTVLPGGIALASMTAGQYGWFFRGNGYCNASVSASISANTAPLYTYTDAGALNSSSAGSAVIVSGASNVTATTSAAVVLCYFNRTIQFN